MKAIILAAGRGSRMKDLTEDCPKCLAHLKGKTLLSWQLDALRDAGIRDIAIVTGYKRELLANFDLVEFHNEKWEKTNMVTSLASAEKWLSSSPCIVSYSDIFYDANAVISLMNSTASLALTYDPNWRVLWEKRFSNPLTDAETFILGVNGHLKEIGQTPTSFDVIEGQYMGLLRFTPAGWAEIQHLRAELSPAQRDAMHMTGTLQKVIEKGNLPVLAIPYYGEWGEVDSAEDLHIYNSH